MVNQKGVFNVIEELKKLEFSSDLRAYVVQYLLDYDDSGKEILNHITDILEYGCSSGVVSELIYYEDTHAFFDRFYDDIEDLRVTSYEYDSNLPFLSDADLKNTLAWFGFEHAVYDIAVECGLI